MKHFIYLIVFTMCLLSCKNEKTLKTKGSDTIAIDINRNVLLFRLAYNLAIEDSIDIKYRSCQNDFYKANVVAYKKYSNHPFVKKIRNGDIWSGDLPVIALAFNKELKPLKTIDKSYLVEHYEWYGEHLDSVGMLMKQFKKDINFKLVGDINFKPFKDSLNANKIGDKLQLFFRTKEQPKLNIVFDPLNNITNKAVTFLEGNKNERTFLIGSFCKHPDSVSNKLSIDWDTDYRRIIIHENSHLYTDELFKKYYDKTLDSLVNQKKFAKEYRDIDEIIVRGITAKILKENYGIKVGKEEIENQPEKSRIVFDYLSKYESNPAMDFETAYQEIIRNLKASYK
ncbi:hypothetical protein [Lacinutrix chionoecetis]